MVIERVRAVLLTPADRLLVIKRVRPGVAPYWVFPGGHVEADDAGLRAALVREVREEVGGEPDVAGLLWVLSDGQQRQYFYLARVRSWSEADRSGPEFGDPARGEYRLEEVAMTADALGAVRLVPLEIAALVRGAVVGGIDLGTLADPMR